MISVLLCLLIAMSAFSVIIPIAAAAETFEKNENFTISHPNALHFYIRHWHSEEVTGGTKFQIGSVESVGRYFVVVEGYIDKNNEGTYDFYFVYQTDMGDGVHYKHDVEKVSPEFAKGSNYIVDMDPDKGSITLKAHPINSEDKDADVIEKFSAFSMSGGQSAVKYGTGDHSDELTITYSPYTHLIKGHVYYVNESRRVDGTVFGNSGLSDNPEEDTVKVYVYTGSDDFAYKHDDGVTVTYKTGDIIKTKARSNVACTDVTDLPNGLTDGENVKLVKYYSTDVGLHTDKTATAYSDGRTFDLELESWYVENYAPTVGMVLDASGSMAFASETPERIKLTEDQIAKLGINKVTADKDPNNSTNGWEDYFLNDTQIENFLNPHNTDNSLLSVSGYNYFVFDSNASAREYAPLGYRGSSSLIGYYSFDDSSNRLRNDVTGNSATVVKQQAADGSNIDFTASGSASGIEYDDNQLSISKNSTAGILLDAKPSGGDFTISFSIVRGSKNAESDPQYPADILYVGDKTPTNKNYLRVIREGINVYGYGKNSGPAGSVRRAWVTGYQGDPSNAQDFVNDIASATSAFHNSTARTITYVFKNGKLTTYFDGTKEINIANNAEIPQTTDLTLDDFNIIFNGFSNSQYNGKNLAIDNISVFDKALTAPEVKAYVKIFNNSNPTDGVMLEGGAALNFGNFTEESGWFFVSHTGNNIDIVDRFDSAKVMYGVSKNFGFVDTIDAPEGEGASTGYSYSPTENTSIRFYVDNDGYLRCFFSRGSSTSSSPNITSYVYELTDPQYVKTESLRRAVGSFITQLSERSPASLFSAVRFSSDNILSDNDTALLLDWTSDYTHAGFLSLTHGEIEEGELRGFSSYDTSESNNKQYNYGLTGSTCTYKGIEAYIKKLDAQLPNLVEKNAPKFLIIFTDGADTDIGKVNDGKAKGYTDQLKGEGYTIFTVLLNGGPVEKGGADYDKARNFLVGLSGNNDCAGSERPEDADKKTDTKTYQSDYFFSVDDAKEEFEKQGMDVSGLNDSDILTKIFTDEILGEIALDREDYTVRDYIDPRFDLVDVKGVVWQLNKGGHIIKSNGEEVDVDESSVIKIELSHQSNTAARKPYLRYNDDNNMYYLEWVNQDFPGCAIGSERLTVWKATITVRAKEDFIGGNAALTNGNGANQNFVFYMDDELSSGTDNSKLPAGITQEDAQKHPLSKGFPRTAVNVMPKDIEKVCGKEIYMGEELLSQTDILNQLIEDTKGTNEYYYWEYLKRYIAYYNDLVSKNTPADELPTLPKKITYVNDEKVIEEIEPGEDGKLKIADLYATILNAKLELPYCYLPGTDKDMNNLTGGNEHREDIFGYLTYSACETEGEHEPYPGDKETSSDTNSRSISLNVDYEPTSVEDRIDADEKLVVEEDGNGNDIYGWNNGYKESVGTELTNDNVPNVSGNHTTTIVSGDIVLQMKIEAEKVNKYIKYINKPFTISYEADLYREYEGSKARITTKEKIGTYFVTYTVTDKMTADDCATASISFTNDFAEEISKYGFPIGTYTLEKGIKATTNTPWLKFSTIGAVKITEDNKAVFENNGVNTDSAKEAHANDYAAMTDGNAAYLGTKAAGDNSYLDYLYALFEVGVEPIDVGNLSVSKTVVDDDESTDEFDFTIELVLPDAYKDCDLSENDFESEYVTAFELKNLGNGIWNASIKLCHDSKILIKDIPAGTAFAVTEGNSKEYELLQIKTTGTEDKESRKASGSIAKDTTATAQFHNKRIIQLPEVGGSGLAAFYISGTALLMVAGLWMICSTMKSRTKRDAVR